MRYSSLFVLVVAMVGCNQGRHSTVPVVEAWTPVEITLVAEGSYDNPYTDVDVWAVFHDNNGDSLIRPAFWDGGDTWRVRFAPPRTDMQYAWRSYSSVSDAGLQQSGALASVAYSGNNKLLQHGLLKMSPGKRNVVHADGKPFLVVGDTPWSIPFRATAKQVKVYANDRHLKGFNTALLMSVQPDRYAEGPEARDSVMGFDRGFEDLADGHLSKLKPDYFKVQDTLIDVLIQHEIVPVLQPVFHGFGWKGKTVLGPTADPHEYARYCRYLVARYGASPAFWLVSADGTGLDPGVKPGGEMIQKWDAYQQPTGIHYNPADDYLAMWAQGDSSKCFHYNRSHQSEPWLDFQWCQTGHDGKHLPQKVEAMYMNTPTKANLNGEPTYEGMGGGKYGLGWWQGDEAWENIMSGATMGVVYGAAGLWQWKITADEPGWGSWTDQPVNWESALRLEGSRYVGLVHKAFDGFDFADMEKHPEYNKQHWPMLAKRGVFYVAYLPQGGTIEIAHEINLPAYWFDPRTGNMRDANASPALTFTSPDSSPWVLLIGER